MSITLTFADELARQIKPYEAEIAEILELGIREWQARAQSGYQGMNSVLEKLAALPTPGEVLELRPSPAHQERLHALLEKNVSEGLSLAEEREWGQFQYLEHLVRMAKASAAQKLRGPG